MTYKLDINFLFVLLSPFLNKDISAMIELPKNCVAAAVGKELSKYHYKLQKECSCGLSTTSDLWIARAGIHISHFKQLMEPG